MRRTKSIVSVLIFAAVSAAPKIAPAQLLGSMNFDEGVGAAIDNPPPIRTFFTPVTTTVVPFQASASVNDGSGAYVTATYNITDNGAVASIIVTASGTITANGNSMGEGTGNYDTTFQLLEPSYFTATMASSGPEHGNITAYDGYTPLIYIGTTPTLLSDSESGMAPVGLISFVDTWDTGYNDPPQPADESGTYSLTLTFTAIPEPSSLSLAALSAPVLLRRRRHLLVKA